MSEVRDPTITRRILSAIDSSNDPNLITDILRASDLEQSEAITRLQAEVRHLVAAEQTRLTETAVLQMVNQQFSNREMGWIKWAVRGVLAGLGTTLLALAGWVFKLALRGLTT